jgi:hypothetical protein
MLKPDPMQAADRDGQPYLEATVSPANWPTDQLRQSLANRSTGQLAFSFFRRCEASEAPPDMREHQQREERGREIEGRVDQGHLQPRLGDEREERA